MVAGARSRMSGAAGVPRPAPWNSITLTDSRGRVSIARIAFVCSAAPTASTPLSRCTAADSWNERVQRSSRLRAFPGSIRDDTPRPAPGRVAQRRMHRSLTLNATRQPGIAPVYIAIAATNILVRICDLESRTDIWISKDETRARLGPHEIRGSSRSLRQNASVSSAARAGVNVSARARAASPMRRAMRGSPSSSASASPMRTGAAASTTRPS